MNDKISRTMSNTLISAVAKNDLDTAKKIIEGGADINFLGEKGYSPLHGASISGFDKMTKLLLENKADTELKSLDSGFTALHFAASEGHIDIVKILLEAGANPNSKDSWGNTPIFQAGNKEEIGKLMILAGGDPGIENENGISPLNSPAMAFKYLQSQSENKEVVNLRALVNKEDINGLTKALASKSGDLEAKNEQGKSPLYLAVEKENIELIQLLLTAGADINTQEKFGYTPLAIAAMRGKLDLVELLIKNGAKTDITLPHNNTLESLAGKHPLVLDFLKNNLKG